MVQYRIVSDIHVQHSCTTFMYVCGTVYTYTVHITYMTCVPMVYYNQTIMNVTQPGTGVYRYKSIRKKNLVLV